MSDTATSEKQVQLSEVSAESVKSDINDINNNSIKTTTTSSTNKDRFGFYISEFHQSLSLSNKIIAQRKNKENERVRKWLNMTKTWKTKGLPTSMFALAQIKRRVRKGVPDSLRNFVWEALVQDKDARKKFPSVADINTSAIPALTLDEIERDIDRTYPKHEQFDSPDSVGQTSLRTVLRWYAAVDPETAYCQGMGFIVGMLLTYMIEEDAFYSFYTIMNKSRYHLRDLYQPSMIRSRQCLFVFHHLQQQHQPALSKHLTDQGIFPSMYVTGWIMTLFTRDFSFDLATRVYEIFLNEGFKIVYRVALALLKSIEKELLSSPFESILTVIRHLPSRVDAQTTITTAVNTYSAISRREIEKLDNQFMVAHENGHEDATHI